MLQKTESLQAPLQSVPAVVSEGAEEVSAPANLLTADQDARLEELTACIETGLVRNYKRSRVVHKIKSFANIVTIGCLTSLSHSVMGFIGWLLFAYLICELFVERIVVDTGFGIWAHRTHRAEREAVRQLAAMDDKRSIPTLINILYWTNDKGARADAARPEVWEALGRLLPRLTEEEIGELDAIHRGKLAGWMGSWDNSLVQRQLGKPGHAPLLGILHVMTVMGQSTVQTPHRVLKTVDLMYVLNKWADGTEAGEDPAVQKAAIACREAIQQRQALTQPGEQLLRASVPPPDSPASLLRPTQETAPTDPQELLRSGSSKDAPIGEG